MWVGSHGWVEAHCSCSQMWTWNGEGADVAFDLINVMENFSASPQDF